jgi:hypothetical protein
MDQVFKAEGERGMVKPIEARMRACFAEKKFEALKAAASSLEGR